MEELIKVKLWKSLNTTTKKSILDRSQKDIESFSTKVKPIINEVKTLGDTAIVKYNKKFEKAEISARALRVKDSEFEAAERMLSKEVKDAINFCIRNVMKYHQLSIKQKHIPFSEITTGVLIGEKNNPIDSVGIYIPRGKGSFPSMVYMLGVPALLAEVPRRVLISPPNSDGTIDPACLYAAKLCKVHEVYKVGGAQGIAALAFGTKTIAPVVKIIGPGSSFVTAAKQYISNIMDVGLPAGPSESIIIADGSTPADLLAYDLCIEAEHGPDSMALVLTHKKEYATQISRHLNKIIAEAPEPQQSTLITVFQKYIGIILTNSEDESISISNSIAPEHLMIHSEYPSATLAQITNAGEILLGYHSPFSLANYATGANAVIPTGGRAKTHSPVSIDDFMKRSTVIKVSSMGFKSLSPHVQTLANYEGFYFHEKALAVRKASPKHSKISNKSTT